MEAAMIEKVLAAKNPGVKFKGNDQNPLDLDGEIFTISDQDAELLFSTMFFRGKF